MLQVSSELRIALVILHADPGRGGAERYTLDLSRLLRQRGHEVSVVASSFAESETLESNVLLSARGMTRAGRYESFLDSLDKHLDQASYDIVHAMLPVRRCDLYHPHAGLAAESLATGHLKYANPLTRSLAKWANKLNQRRRRLASVERELLGSAKPPIVLCLSQYVKGTVRCHFPLPDDRLSSLFNAVDLDRFDPQARPKAGCELRESLRIPQDRVVALMIAQDFERKGLADAVMALPKIDDGRLVLVVAGKEDPQRYKQLAARLNVGERVIFAGATADPYPFYKAADCFVLPTRHDPCSLVVLEALAMGLPVISTVFNGACEIMDQRHGLVLRDPRDIDALAGAMRQMLDPSYRSACAQACLELRPELSYARHVDRLLEIYQGSRRT